MIVRGQKINDRYQIIKLIGEGGMANVYLAHDMILDRDVAVKVLRGDLADDEKFVRRFQREAISASSLSHPNIVEMYDVGEDNGQYFIVMEYVDGKTLKSLIKRRGALTLPEVVDIMLQLTSAIACAHDSYIIHRDIKPQNVLILDNGVVKITDFGIATALNNNEATQTNSVMGSVHYLPPEQANGNGATMKSDIYSLGILMYELLTGKIPFKGENAVEIAIKQMREEIPSVREENPDIPQSIENIIIKACAKNPANRYDSVKDMYEDVKVALTEEHANDHRVIYQYPEQDLDDTKMMPKLSRSNRRRTPDLDDDKKKPWSQKKKIIVFGLIGFLIISLIAFFTFGLPMIMKSPEIEVPDVSGKKVSKASDILEDKGFEVNSKTKKVYDDDIKEGRVVKTDPAKGRTVKKGKEITLYVSKGSKKVKIKNYVGKNVNEVKINLENKGLKVEIEKRDVTDGDNYKENIIIEQSVKAKETLNRGDAITLYIPNIVVVYPDFVAEGYTKEQVQKFCDDNNITLSVDEVESSSRAKGTVVSQSRAAGTKVVSGTPLRITVAKSVNTYTVAFESNGGSSINNQTIKENGTVTRPSNPTRDGYKFIGWYYNGSSYNFSSKVTKDMTLIAKWEEVKDDASRQNS